MVFRCGQRYSAVAILREGVREGGSFEFRRMLKTYRPRPFQFQDHQLLVNTGRNAMENTSGQGKAAVVPDEVKGLAWGAFLWSWIWGLFNRTWIALLVFVPIVGLVMWVMLLLKGREWAWRNKHWDSMEHFNKVQRNWAKAFLIVLFVPFLLGIIAAIVIPMMGNNAKQNVAEVTSPALPPDVSTPAEKPVPPAVVSASVATIAPATSATPAQSASAVPGSRLTTPEELKEFNTESDRNAKGKGLVADISQTDRKTSKKVKEQPSAVADREPTFAVVPDRPYQTASGKVVTPKFNDVMTAVLRQDQAGVTELLDLGWWVDKPDPNGFTPLMEAVAMGDAPMAELLLKRGANPNAAARDGSLLQIAKRNRDAAMIELLRRYGATAE